MSSPVELRRYRVELEVPRVARPQQTTWRTLAIRDSYSEVSDLADYLIESMVLEGIPLALARGWVAKRLRVKPSITATVSGDPEPLPLYSPKIQS